MGNVLRARMFNKYSKIHVNSFKTLDGRASGLNFLTPSCAYSWSRGRYQKLP